MVNILAIIVSTCFIIYFMRFIDMTDMIGEVYNSKINFEGKLFCWIFGVMEKAACMTGFVLIFISIALKRPPSDIKDR